LNSLGALGSLGSWDQFTVPEAATWNNPHPGPVAQATRPGLQSAGGAQLLPEILVDRHLVRVERLLAANNYGAAHEVMLEIIALQVAFGAGRTETAGRGGGFDPAGRQEERFLCDAS
jgi:hypothetical protein